MYAQSYVDRLVKSTPTWHTCVDLHAVAPWPELERVMGGIASALRSGSETTHQDWGNDWIELSLLHLDGMQPLEDMAKAGRYEDLDDWLSAHEQRIIEAIHAAYSHRVRDQAQPGNGGNR